jgi:hypothetical protein
MVAKLSKWSQLITWSVFVGSLRKIPFFGKLFQLYKSSGLQVASTIATPPAGLRGPAQIVITQPAKSSVAGGWLDLVEPKIAKQSCSHHLDVYNYSAKLEGC